MNHDVGQLWRGRIRRLMQWFKAAIDHEGQPDLSWALNHRQGRSQPVVAQASLVFHQLIVSVVETLLRWRLLRDALNHPLQLQHGRVLRRVQEDGHLVTPNHQNDPEHPDLPSVS